jgi:ribonuclease T2
MHRFSRLIAVLLAMACAAGVAGAQGKKSQPGQFDFYELTLSWSPAFCDTMKTLTPGERAQSHDDECTSPHDFVVHGLWPQNFDGSYPQSCSNRPGPTDPQNFLDIIPNVSLIKHEWAKHGTCTTLAPDAYFSAARQAYKSVAIPATLKGLNHELNMPPAQLLSLFQQANPSFPKGSFALSCGNNQLTAVEACFSKDLKAIACQGLKSCKARTVKVEPETPGQTGHFARE